MTDKIEGRAKLVAIANARRERRIGKPSEKHRANSDTEALFEALWRDGEAALAPK